MQERRQDRLGQLDAGRLYRAALQGAWQVPAAAGRFEVAAAVGLEGAYQRDVRSGGTFHQGRVTQFRVPLPIARAFRRNLQELLRADAESLCRARRGEPAGIKKRSARADHGTMVVPGEYLETVITKR